MLVVHQVFCHDHVAQRRDLPLEQTRRGLRLRNRHEHRRGAVLEDAGLATQVLLDLCPAEGRIQRRWHAARGEHAEERGEVHRARRQHDRHRLTGLDAAAPQAVCDGARAGGKLAVGDPMRLPVAFEQRDMHPAG